MFFSPDPSRSISSVSRPFATGERQSERTLGLVAARGVGTLSIRAITPEAISGRIDLPVQSGECVSIVFEEQQQHAGAVRWVRGPLIGVHLVIPLSPALLQGRPVGCLAPREPRFNIARHVTIHHNGAIWDSVIRNVSRNGMLIDSLPDLTPGSRVRIGCGAMAVISAVVRWVHHRQAGLRLVEPLDPARFEALTGGAAPYGKT